MIRAVFENAEVKARLLAMSQVARERVYRRVMRRNAKPVVNQLTQAWKGARRRQGEITGDIAWAQESRLKFKRRGGSVPFGRSFRIACRIAGHYPVVCHRRAYGDR